jgi:hypothetical protein
MSVNPTTTTATNPLIPVIEGAKVCFNHLGSIASEVVGPITQVSTGAIKETLREADSELSNNVDNITTAASDWAADPENKGYVNTAKLVGAAALILFGISNMFTMLIGAAGGLYLKTSAKETAHKVQECWNNQSSAVKTLVAFSATVLAWKFLPITMVAALLGGAASAIILSDYVGGKQEANQPS